MPTDSYSVQIFYSEDDGGFIAVVPQLKGCSAFGKTREDAAREIQIAMDLWLASARDSGWAIPKPAKRTPVLPWSYRSATQSRTNLKTKRKTSKTTMRKVAASRRKKAG